MECYYPLVKAAGFNPSDFSEDEIFLLAGRIIEDPEFSRLRMADDAAEAKWLLRKYGTATGEKDPSLANVENPFERAEIQAANCVNQMNPVEKLALRTRIISANRWLADKLAPHKTKRGAA